MAGRKRTPTALRVLRGNPGGRPLNDREPSFSATVPGISKHLSAEAVAEWKRVAKLLADAGVLTEIDMAVLAAYCQSYGIAEQASQAIAKMAARDELTSGLMIKSAKGNAVPNPLVWIASAARRDSIRYAAELGMTPAARSKIQVSEALAEKANPFLALRAQNASWLAG